jgi:hypothetical protein
MPNIGVVSSINFKNTLHQIQFNAGVASLAAGVVPTYQIKDKLGFGNRMRIAAAINALATNTASPVDCIVTTGGLFCCHEALLNVGTKPFISLIGYPPSAPFPQPGGIASPFRGCVTLDSSALALVTARVDWILSPAPRHFHTVPAHIGLLYDPNTAMATQEIKAFQAELGIALLPTGQVVDAKNGLADPDQFSADFNAFDNTIESVIISAAPRFGKYKEQLIAAANESGLNICYPLQGYQNGGGTNKPVAGKTVFIGPDINAIDNTGAYFLLGQMAWTLSHAPGTALAPPIQTAPSLTVIL